jgi:hypothetical protein
MDGSVRNMILGSIILVLVSMYGGDTMGSWFVMKIELENADTDSYYTGTENYYLTGAKSELEYSGSDMPDDEDSSEDYDDDECTVNDGELVECKELSGLMLGKIQNLLYVVILAGFAALYFLNEDDEEKASLAALVMGGASLIAVIMFGLSFPEALEDDAGIWEIMEDSFDMNTEPTLFGTESEEMDGSELTFSWRPDIAFVLVALSGILGIAAYVGLNSESSNTSSYQNEYQSTSRIHAQHHQVESTSMPSIPSLQGPIASLESNQIQCPNCKIIVDGNLQNCPNCGFQNR